MQKGRVIVLANTTMKKVSQSVAESSNGSTISFYGDHSQFV